MEKNRTASQEVILLSIGFASVAIVVLIILVWLYPIGYGREVFRRPMSVWYLVYGLAIAMVSVSVVGISSLWTSLLAQRPIAASVCAGVSTFLVQLIYCIAVLNIMPSGFGLRIVDIMNARFLAEWQFLKFVGVISPVSALLSGVLTWINLRR